MKKYWKSIFTLALIVIGLSMFLLQSSFASSDLPRFELEHKSGDESLVEDVIVTGSYVQSNNHSSFIFNGDETEYSQEHSFTEYLLNAYGYDPIRERLTDEYRDFMRGQPYLHHNFFESEEALVIVEEEWDYTGQSRVKLNVSYLNKETQEEQHKVINVENTHYASVMEVQYIDGRIYLYVQYTQEDDKRIIREFVYDVESKTIVSDQEVFESEEREGTRYVDVRKLNESVTHAPTTSMVFRVTDALLEEGKDGLREVEREEKLYKYEIKNGEMTPLDLSAEEYGVAEYFDGQFIYFVQGDSGDSIKVLPYDIESDQFMDAIEIPQSGSESRPEHQASPFFDVKDQHIYMLDENNVNVIDATTGETVYEGQIAADEEFDFEELRIERLTFE